MITHPRTVCVLAKLDRRERLAEVARWELARQTRPNRSTTSEPKATLPSMWGTVRPYAVSALAALHAVVFGPGNDGQESAALRTAP